jgi:hypothetical protein
MGAGGCAIFLLVILFSIVQAGEKVDVIRKFSVCVREGE